MKSKCKSEKSKKSKQENNIVLKENEKRNRDDVCYVTFKYLFTCSMHIYIFMRIVIAL